MADEYERFLESKAIRDVPTGLREVDATELGEWLFPHQKALTAWALRRGRAAVFAQTGLGKSRIALTWAAKVWAHTGGRILILTPLAVARQFEREAQSFGMSVTVCRDRSDVRDGVNIINYDRLHHIDPDAFVGVVADESSILKDHTAATRTRLIEAFANTPWKLSCTATPAPNDFIELGNQCEFLGVLSRAEMLSTFFTHDGGSTQDWHLKKHGAQAFWEWVASWGALVRKPSDLGFDDGAYELPPLVMHEHIIPGDIEQAHKAGMLFVMPAKGIKEQRAARRGSLDRRVKKAVQLVATNPGPWLLWVDLNDEGDALEESIPGAVQVKGSDSAEEKEERLLAFADGKIPVLISKSSICGHGMNFQACAHMAFVGSGYSFEQRYQAIRRCWRFGQKREVTVHVVVGEAEAGALDILKRKEADAEQMGEEMSVLTKRFVNENVLGAHNERKEYAPTVRAKLPKWLSRGEVA